MEQVRRLAWHAFHLGKFMLHSSVDREVSNVRVEQLNGERIREALTAHTAEQEQAKKAIAEKRSKLEAELAELDRKIGRWLEAFELGGDLAELGTERLAQLRAERTAAAKHLADLATHPHLPPFLYKPAAARALQERLRSAFASHDRDLVRGVLEALVERLVVDRGEVVVYYRLDGLVALLAEKGCGVGVETTLAKVRTDVYRWRANPVPSENLRRRVVIPLPRRQKRQKPLPSVVRLLDQATRWQAALDRGEPRSRAELGRQEGVSGAYVGQLLKLLWLPPAWLAFIRALPPGTPERLVSTKRLCSLVGRPIAEQLHELERVRRALGGARWVAA